MVASSTANQPAPVKFTVQQGGRSVQLTYRQVFIAAHKLWLARKYAEAAKVFQHLSAVSDRGPRAHILLAHCKVMLGDYAGCSATLSEALPVSHFENAASDLHEAFVMWKCTLYHNVKQGLEKVVAEHPDLPTPCLILGEFLLRAGNCQQPQHLLMQAIERDRPDGAIATIARSELPSILESVPTPPARSLARRKSAVHKGPKS